MRMPADRELPSHQEWRNSGHLVKRRMTFDDVLSGHFVGNTAAISHRWPEEGRFDPDGAKLRKLQAIFQETPSIRYVWIDWSSMPQPSACPPSVDEDEKKELGIKLGKAVKSIPAYVLTSIPRLILNAHVPTF